MARHTIKYLPLRGIHIFDQLRFEEILLRHTKDNWFIYNFGHRRPTIVLGMSGKVNELLHTHKVARDKVQMIRRYTGGGTVVVDESTIFSTLIMNNKEADTAPYPREIMNWSEKFVYGPLFADVLSKKKSQNNNNNNKNTNNNLESSTAKFSLREHDYTIGDMKIGGNAQTITKDRWVHHTSFLWDYNPAKMEYLKLPAKRPQYRSDRHHNSFLTRLKLHMSSREEFEGLIVKTLEENYNIETATFEEVETICEQVMRNEVSIDKVIRSKVVDIDDYLQGVPIDIGVNDDGNDDQVSVSMSVSVSGVSGAAGVNQQPQQPQQPPSSPSSPANKPPKSLVRQGPSCVNF